MEKEIKSFFKVAIKGVNWKPSIQEVSYNWADWQVYQGLQFEGYASTKDIDRTNDVVLPEAFANCIKQYMDNPIIFLQHDSSKPIWSIIEATIDENWLYVKWIVKSDKENIFQDLRTWVIKTMSFWYRVLDYNVMTKQDQEWNTVQVNEIKELELFEISLVSVPMNPKAQIKSKEDLKGLPDDEYSKYFQINKKEDYTFIKSISEAMEKACGGKKKPKKEEEEEEIQVVEEEDKKEDETIETPNEEVQEIVEETQETVEVNEIQEIINEIENTSKDYKEVLHDLSAEWFEKERNVTYAKFFRDINMTSSELKARKETEKHLYIDSLDNNINLKWKNKSQWTQKDCVLAKKSIELIKKTRSLEKDIEDKEIYLKDFWFDPLKKRKSMDTKELMLDEISVWMFVWFRCKYEWYNQDMMWNMVEETILYPDVEDEPFIWQIREIRTEWTVFWCCNEIIQASIENPVITINCYETINNQLVQTTCYYVKEMEEIIIESQFDTSTFEIKGDYIMETKELVDIKIEEVEEIVEEKPVEAVEENKIEEEKESEPINTQPEEKQEEIEEVKEEVVEEKESVVELWAEEVESKEEIEETIEELKTIEVVAWDSDTPKEEPTENVVSSEVIEKVDNIEKSLFEIKEKSFESITDTQKAITGICESLETKASKKDVEEVKAESEKLTKAYTDLAELTKELHKAFRRITIDWAYSYKEEPQEKVNPLLQTDLAKKLQSLK